MGSAVVAVAASSPLSMSCYEFIHVLYVLSVKYYVGPPSSVAGCPLNRQMDNYVECNGLSHYYIHRESNKSTRHKGLMYRFYLFTSRQIVNEILVSIPWNPNFLLKFFLKKPYKKPTTTPLYFSFAVLHTSASLALNESWDPDVRDDMEMMLNKIVPEGLPYRHSCEGPDDMVSQWKAYSHRSVTHRVFF